jgi:hypothetical protein
VRNEGILSMDGYEVGSEAGGGDGMKILWLKARNIGYGNYLETMRETCFGDLGLWAFKFRYGLVSLPWWMKPAGIPITDPRRLLTAGESGFFAKMYADRVAVKESYMRPTSEYPMGSYKLEVGGKIITACGAFAQEGVPDSPYWHGGPPFVTYTELGSWPWKDEDMQ